MEPKNDVQLFGTSNLCFDKDIFMRPDFNVDDFMRDYQCNGDGSLEMLRDHLGVYLKILRSAMIDLINRDYADFVNLSTNLTGLDSLIQTLSVPLGQLREEVLSVSQLLESVSSGVLSDMEKQKKLLNFRRKLNTITEITHRLDSMESLVDTYMNDQSDTLKTVAIGSHTDVVDGNLEEAVRNLCLEACSREEMLNCLSSGLSYMNYLVKSCKDSQMIQIYSPRIERLQNIAEKAIEQNIIECLSLNSSKKDVELLEKTLIACTALDCTKVAENVIQKLVTPKIKDLVNVNSVKNNPRGLAGVLSNVLSHIQEVLSSIILLTVPQRKSKSAAKELVSGFQILECSVFPEIVDALSNMPDFFSPANPTSFHLKYEQCITFIESFEDLLVTRRRVEAFRISEVYINFMEKWNFPVYFQIRNQEIGQVVESALCEGFSKTDVSKLNRGTLILQSSKCVFRALKQCWLPDIFMKPLLHRFWKMTLLILSRHRTWLDETVLALENNEFNNPAFKSRMKLPQSTEISLYLVADLLTLQDVIKKLYKEDLAEQLSEASESCRTLIADTLTSESNKLAPFVNRMIQSVCKSVGTAMISALQPVTDTPRLYRRTNRAAPSQAQSYVSLAVDPLLELRDVASLLLPQDMQTRLLSDICSAFTSQYYELTHEVLQSVLKTEESLKRLKRARKGVAPSASQTNLGLSDEDKIREQLHEDVQQMRHLLGGSVGVDISELPALIRLTEVVNEARCAQEK